MGWAEDAAHHPSRVCVGCFAHPAAARSGADHFDPAEPGTLALGLLGDRAGGSTRPPYAHARELHPREHGGSVVKRSV